MSTPAKIHRSVRGEVRMTAEARRDRYGNYHGYDSLTLDDVERFCIEARMYGASPGTTVGVWHGGSTGPDHLSITVPATFEAIPVAPNAGKNARLNRRLAVAAFSAFAACFIMGLALVAALVV